MQLVFGRYIFYPPERRKSIGKRKHWERIVKNEILEGMLPVKIM